MAATFPAGGTMPGRQPAKSFCVRRAIFLGAICLGLVGAATVAAADTDQIQQLTVERAKELAQDKSGRLLLGGLKTLPPEVARELAKHEGALSLNGLKDISNDAAAALGQHKGALYLDGLSMISDASAAGLAAHQGDLSLNGLTAIPDEIAGGLVRHTGGWLSLKGLTTLSPAAARALVQRKGGYQGWQLHLDGLTTLSPEAAAALAEMSGHKWNGHLPRFTTVPDDVARALAKEGSNLRSMPGLTAISDEAAKLLVPRIGGNLPALKALSTEVAKALSQSGHHLVLNGVTTLSDEAAKALTEKAMGRNVLYLNGLTSLSPVAAKAICQREGDLYLNGLTTIPIEVLKSLTEHKSPGYARPVVYLDGLTSLTDEAAAILASWPKWSGELPALPSLSEKIATALAASPRWDGKLPAVRMIPVEVAQALAQRRGDLSLDSLTTLADDGAAALAKHRGYRPENAIAPGADKDVVAAMEKHRAGTLSLNGLTSLSEKAAAALAQHDGRLSLGGLKTLSGSAAQSLAGYKGERLDLNGLQTLDAAAAKALAQGKSVASLTGLQTLPPDAAKALAANRSVAIPRKFQAPAIRQGVAADWKSVQSFLKSHCADCHDEGVKKGDFTLDRLSKDDVSGRVDLALVLERLRAGDMPPQSEPRPKPDDLAQAIGWISAKLDSPLSGPPAYYAVKEKPIDGNRLPNAILFGGPRGPGVPPPPRLWRLSPAAYTTWTGEFKSDANGVQQPFGVIQETGIKDFAALYSPDEGASGLLLTNAELIVGAQTRVHALVNMNDAAFAKENLWPNEARAKAATAAEQEALKSGLRVRHGHNASAALLHPHVKATREELEKVLRGQYQTALARQPSEQELASVVALYDATAANGDKSIAGKTALMAPLMTPEAILRFEVGLGPEIRPGVRSLSPRETAMAISLALSTKRDPGLLSAATEGKLTTREEVAASVRRILDDPKISKPLVMGFFREYFDYYRAPEVFKDPLPDYLPRRGVHYNPRRHVEDTDLLILRILGRDRDVLKELLTTKESFHGRGDGERFGLNFPAFHRLPPGLDPDREMSDTDRIGILMHPSWHVAWSTNFHNDIVRRGRWVREHLLGGRVPDLPINAAAMVPDDPHHTLRQRQMVTRAAECWKCHNKMDELGLPFEDLDHYGFRRRGELVLDLEAMAQAKDKNQKIYRDAPLDTTGSIANSGDPQLDGPVRDAPEMLRRLAESDRVRQIFIRHVFRYFLGRNETPGDAVSLQEAEKAYLDNGGSFKTLIVSLLSSESFLYRTVPAGIVRK